ncbi:hypothetical protein NEDG_02054 [Nematocida displodere]|uniref:MADS-box domain-containing protein n=1 Tax=Nematocida displodere TaxID=1805483 RepID=A0A177EJY8_9MICR|nr:hypothetical protein NEDG_02054 [Nematocida displodere]
MNDSKMPLSCFRKIYLLILRTLAMVELRESRSDNSSRTASPYERSENHNIKNFSRKGKDDTYHIPSRPFISYQEKEEYDSDRQAEEYLYQDKEYRYSRNEEFIPVPYDRPAQEMGGPIPPHPPFREGTRPYPQQFSGRQVRSNSISTLPLLSLGRSMEAEAFPRRPARDAPLTPQMANDLSSHPPASDPNAPMSTMRLFRKDDLEDSGDSDNSVPRINKGRKKIKMEFIKDKGRRGVTFSKRKKGIMKKAYELNVLTKCEILLVVASETGHVYTFATPKLQPIIKQHESLIQQYLNAPGAADVGKIYETQERFNSENAGYYKNTDTYNYDGILRGHGYPSGYYHNGYDTDSNSPGGPAPRM